MIYNNGTVSVHKSYINSLLFAATRSGLVEDGLKAKGMIRESKNEALLELDDYYSVGIDGCIEEQLQRAVDILADLKIRTKVQIDFYGDGGDAKGYTNVDSIKMFGGNTSQLAGDIMTTVTQVSDGIKESTGIDPTSLLTGALQKKNNRKTTEKKDPVETTETLEDYTEVTE